MNKNSIIIALVSLLVGVAIGWGASQMLVSSAQLAVSSGAVSASSSSQDSQSATSTSGPSSSAAGSEGSTSSAEGNPSAASSSPASADIGSSSQRDDLETSAEKDAQPRSDNASADSDWEQSGSDADGDVSSSSQGATEEGGASVIENGTYTSKEEVAAYIHAFGHLPSNYISKSKAKKAGWVSSQGNLDEVLPGMSIGGSEFYNDEGLLPDAPGRSWTECDINYEGGYRGAERIVFSNDGLIFYTADHYESFEQLY